MRSERYFKYILQSLKMQIDNLSKEWDEPKEFDESKLRELHDSIEDYFDVVENAKIEAVDSVEQDSDKKQRFYKYKWGDLHSRYWEAVSQIAKNKAKGIYATEFYSLDFGMPLEDFIYFVVRNISRTQEFKNQFGEDWRTSYRRTEVGAIVTLLPVPNLKNDGFDALCTGFASSVDFAEKRTA